MLSAVYPRQTVFFFEGRDEPIKRAQVTDEAVSRPDHEPVVLLCNNLIMLKHPSELYSSYEAASRAQNALKDALLNSYVLVMQNKADLLHFMADRNITWYAPKTDWQARKAAAIKAPLCADGLHLHQISGAHSHAGRLSGKKLPIGQDAWYLDSRRSVAAPGHILSYICDNQRAFCRLRKAESEEQIVVPVEWVFSSEQKAAAQMDGLFEVEFERCCQEVKSEEDLFTLAYSYPVSLDNPCLNLPARRALIMRTRDLMHIEL